MIDCFVQPVFGARGPAENSVWGGVSGEAVCSVKKVLCQCLGVC